MSDVTRGGFLEVFEHVCRKSPADQGRGRESPSTAFGKLFSRFKVSCFSVSRHSMHR